MESKTKNGSEEPRGRTGIKTQMFTTNYTVEYCSAIKKHEILPFAATWMDLDIIILSEVSQKEKDKYHMTSYTWNLKKSHS